MSQAILHATGLSKAYGSTTALFNLDLAVAQGESLAIMGASGSGKTTLLHVLAGITEPDAGHVLFAASSGPLEIAGLGESERSRLRREEFGFVFQSGLLIPELTAIENVGLALMLTGVSRAEALREAATWLSQLGLAGMEDRRIGQLSGGQAQRVTGAAVIFADEPTGALDSRTGAEVMTALLASTVGQGRTLIVVTHDATVAAQCSRTVHMRDGRLEGVEIAA
jgi:putative ABC transport system ATP-binding protein